jgi:hypothetical protein
MRDRLLLAINEGERETMLKDKERSMREKWGVKE